MNDTKFYDPERPQENRIIMNIKTQGPQRETLPGPEVTEAGARTERRPVFFCS